MRTAHHKVLLFIRSLRVLDSCLRRRKLLLGRREMAELPNGYLWPKKCISTISRLKRSATIGHAGWLRQTAMRGMAACSQMLPFAVAGR